VRNLVESVKIIGVESENHSCNSHRYQDEKTTKIDPYTMFLHVMRSPVTKKKYSRRLEMFFDFIQIPRKSIEDRCQTFVDKGQDDIKWIYTNILRFVLFHKKRIDKKEISGATLINYLKAIRLFYEMSDISINWKT
jgi:hypothetical protein